MLAAFPSDTIAAASRGCLPWGADCGGSGTRRHQVARWTESGCGAGGARGHATDHATARGGSRERRSAVRIVATEWGSVTTDEPAAAAHANAHVGAPRSLEQGGPIDASG